MLQVCVGPRWSEVAISLTGPRSDLTIAKGLIHVEGSPLFFITVEVLEAKNEIRFMSIDMCWAKVLGGYEFYKLS